MFCKKCGKPISDSEKTCLNCGAEAARKYLPKYSLELYYCKSCGREADKNDAFCRKCGAALNFSDIITETTISHKEPKPIKNSKWMYIPFYPQTRRDETAAEAEEPSGGTEITTESTPEDIPADIPAATEKAEEAPKNEEPVKEEPLTFDGEINIEVTDDEAPAEETKEPEFAPAYKSEENDVSEEEKPEESLNEEFTEPAHMEEGDADETSFYESEKFTSFDEEPKTAESTEQAEYIPPEPAPIIEEESENPDLTLTSPTENADFIPQAETPAAAEPEKEELSAQSDEPMNYSDGEEKEEKPDKDATVSVSKPMSVPEKMAFGVIAIAIAILCPPLGIILGIMTTARGWSVANKTYVRLGIAAIVVGLAMTIALCVLSWKIFIPAIETYFKSIE